MSFFKEFKEDLTQEVNNLFSDENTTGDNEAANPENVKEKENMDNNMVNIHDDDSIDGFDLDAISNLLGNEETGEVREDYLPSDDVTEITQGTAINGNISSSGSINIYGQLTGEVSCRGKLVIAGTVKGTSQAGEIFANNSKIEGDIKSDGSVKIGNGAVIIGNVYATSAVIGGAVKGDIDVHGPVIIDATAVIQGNIKSRSVQINNGAAIEGFCSQCYADIDYQALFDDTFEK